MKKLIILFVFVLGACADSHTLVKTGGNTSSAKLSADKSIYISLPEDGRYGTKVYPGSGHLVTQIIAAEFSKKTHKVESGRRVETADEALSAAKKIGASYLVIPTILHWEHRNTAWSGLPNQSSIKILITDVISDRTIDSVVINGKSGLATLGGDNPQDLLPKPVSEYIGSLY